MDHRRGTDPTPQGRTPNKVRHSDQKSPANEAEAKYESSAPGPDAMKDGAAFYGFKNEQAVRPADEP